MVAGMGADPIYNRSYEEQLLAEAPATEMVARLRISLSFQWL